VRFCGNNLKLLRLKQNSMTLSHDAVSAPKRGVRTPALDVAEGPPNDLLTVQPLL
jgi:hypothetical protein